MTSVPDHDTNDKFAPKRALVFTAAALGLGLVFDILFFEKLPGISFPLFVGLTLASLAIAALHRRRKLPRSALLMVLPILFFSSMVAIRASEFLTFLNIVMTLYLLGMFVSLVMKPRLSAFGFGDYFTQAGRVAAKAIDKIGVTLKPLVPKGGLIGRSKEFSHVMRGALITLPIVLIFVALFSSADLVFRGYVDDLFNFQISSDLFWQIFWLLAVASAFVGLFGLLDSAPEDGADKKAALKPIKFGLVETSILFGALNVLFLVFIAIQVTYLFGGASNVVHGEFTYAEYARKGFFELVAVAGLSLLLISVADRLLLRERETHDIRFKVLSGLLAAQVLIIMVSAFKRLNLYEQAYGFTSLRLYSYIFIIWLALVFLVLLYKIFAGWRESKFAFTVFVAGLALLASFNLLNVDGTVARKNIDRYENTGKLDIRYLDDLSDDAVSQLTRLLDSRDEKLRDNAAAALYLRRKALLSEDKNAWQSYNLTRDSALTALDKHVEQLEKGHQNADPSYNGPGQ